MQRIVVISGGLGSPSSTRVLSDDIVARLRDSLAAKGEELEVTVAELRELAHPIVDAMLTGFPTGELARITDAVAAADGLIVVSPTFSASISGLFKSFFDILDMDTLKGKQVLMAATGGTERHSLMLEFAMRPLFSYLGALTMRTAIFAATSDFGGPGVASLGRRVRAGADELADALVGSKRKVEVDDFVEFATLLRN
ncbi:NAD(P)H-dependent oxidoreductase [Tessaracoccus sp. MC1865]|uniref:CE1759 family FMN reductase n=1 Tax=Tessaracoccus sp. MC1865 TaxID=2760310 RepID=UPI0015FECB4E|nr:CE1759 family FMN reductase [Tessaracoccus sp. MC1865]MBB1483244.1 NAD(P)H-dependent oxidoreductase [Tessaracoccus sp. MC1865]QTO37343.1 NAD(P)H-dependent oxidoreductase [Tessaracoccus sp. MC1865]